MQKSLRDPVGQFCALLMYSGHDQRDSLRSQTLYPSGNGELIMILSFICWQNAHCCTRHNYRRILSPVQHKKCGPVQLSRYSDPLLAGWSGDRIPAGTRFSTPFQTVPGAHHPASYTMGTVSLSRGWGRPGDACTIHFHQVPRLKKEYSYTSTPPLGPPRRGRFTPGEETRLP
jgi:hypothetical protein